MSFKLVIFFTFVGLTLVKVSGCFLSTSCGYFLLKNYLLTQKPHPALFIFIYIVLL